MCAWATCACMHVVRCVQAAAPPQRQPRATQARLDAAAAARHTARLPSTRPCCRQGCRCECMCACARMRVRSSYSSAQANPSALVYLRVCVCVCVHVRVCGHKALHVPQPKAGASLFRTCANRACTVRVPLHRPVLPLLGRRAPALSWPCAPRPLSVCRTGCRSTATPAAPTHAATGTAQSAARHRPGMTPSATQPRYVRVRVHMRACVRACVQVCAYVRLCERARKCVRLCERACKCVRLCERACACQVCLVAAVKWCSRGES